MAVSGTYTWDLDILNIIEEAYELAGNEARSGYDLRTAVRSINLLMREWENKGINLWTIDDYSLALTATDEFSLDAEILDVLEVVERDGSDDTDQLVQRISLEEMHVLPDKENTDADISTYYAIERNRGGVVLHLYPTPSSTAVSNGNTLEFWAFRRIADIDRGKTGYEQNADVPTRFLPALTLGLAYKLSQKIIANKMTSMDVQSLKYVMANSERLKRDYMESMQEAMEADRDRTSIFIIPGWGRR